ncbi:hypothetical protein RHSIM_Rhsim02G0034300 [Rhododendron simsii]|uniref:Serine hydrolase domain-containing protein n=1 Tax=Rhododendron simsii TaxID=118357 RepID=A0A834LTX7_RHOSS|nr:hypothetical protein RHSIM_Rhsim02G0034300 [Rhododendron simsii]
MYSQIQLPKWTLSTNPFPIQNPCTTRTGLANPRRTGNNHVHNPKTESLASDENGLPRRSGGGGGAAVEWKGNKISLTVPDKVNGGVQPGDVVFATAGRPLAGSGKSSLLDALAGRVGRSTRHSEDVYTNGHQQTRASGTLVTERPKQTGEEIGKTGKGDTESPILKKPKLLCLHGYRTSSEILQKQLQKWPESLLGRLDLDFIDAPFPALGKSDVEDIFDPPYYEWFQYNEDYTEYYNFEETIAYIEDYMIKHGPFDGILGFSQGGIIAASIPGMQSNGVALTTVPKIKYLIIISGGKFGGSTPSSNGYLGHIGSPVLCADSFSSPVKCPSLHIIGEKDTFMGLPGTELVESFVDPVVIKHRHGHTVIRPNPTDRETILSFIEKMEKM